MRSSLLALTACALLAACAEKAPLRPLPLARAGLELAQPQRAELERTLARLFGAPSAPKYAVLPELASAGVDPNAAAPTGLSSELAAAIQLDARARFHEALLRAGRGQDPDSERLPASMRRRLAAGGDQQAAIESWQPDLAEAAVRYQSQCATCHGIAGGGDGPSAAALVPPPRDFREGNFRYHQRGEGHKPSHDDLVAILRRGIAGSGMPLFAGVGAAVQSGLADYVRFLSLRGEVERAFVERAARGETPTDAEMDQVYAEAWARWAILPGHGDASELVRDASEQQGSIER